MYDDNEHFSLKANFTKNQHIQMKQSKYWCSTENKSNYVILFRYKLYATSSIFKAQQILQQHYNCKCVWFDWPWKCDFNCLLYK